MEMTGAEIICESLLREGVDTIFGLPGGAVLPFYGALSGYPNLRHILVRHEQAAAMAADGYARATGKVGVCSATSGPGATNLVTGLASAQMDSVPIVCITGQVPRPAIGRDAFQETDITGITLPVTKHNYLIMDVREIAPAIKEAFHIARTGRPGPVLIDVPKDVLAGEKIEFEWPDAINLPGYEPPGEPDPTADRGGGSPDQPGRASRHPGRPRRPDLPAPGMNSASSPKRPRSPSSRRCWALAPCPRITCCTWACRGCTAWPTPASPSTAPTW